MPNDQQAESVYSFQSSNVTNKYLFIVQIFVILLVVMTSLVMLTLERGNTNLWTALLSSCLGYILPNPKIKVDQSIKRGISDADSH